ncbi:MAG: MFS transporter, partial [Promethearchaeota archaeon]
SNYLYFVIDISESTLGFISSAGAIAYIFAPIIGQVITSKLGIRNSIILSSLFTPILTGAQIIYFETWFLVLCRISLGLMLGVYWPNCFNLLSKWQKVSSVEKSKKNFRNFNFSWNYGFIIGLLTGFSWAFYWNDYLAMVISWSLSFLLIPISFFINKESESIALYEDPKEQLEVTISEVVVRDNLEKNSNTPMIIYPILFSWIGILFLAISKASFIFSYPIILKAVGSSSYPTYLVQAGVQFTQVLGLTWINSMKIYSRKISTLFSIILIVLIASTVLFFRNIWYISIITAITGLFLGLIHGTALKIMLEYGTAKSTAKYSTINEILVGLGFGLTPIIAGYVAEVNIYVIFTFLIIFGPFILILLVYLSRNVKKEKI